VQVSDVDAKTFSLLARQHFGDAGPVLESVARPSVRLQRAEACPADDTGSRFGGTPLLPPGCAWPVTRAGQPLSFLAQVSTADIQVPAGNPDLPADTLLAFFYEAKEQRGWGFDPADQQFWKVIAVPKVSGVAAVPPPEALPFPAYRMLPRTVRTIPDYGEPALAGLDADYDDFERMPAELDQGDAAPRHRMFGWPDLVQNPVELEPGAADRLLLLQLDTDDDIGWMWGDAGTLYYWIREQDLRTGRFDRTWMIFQCC
jgi:uncharacterized protein YwqG